MVTDLNKMEYLLNTKRCYCLNLNEKKIKRGQHNEKLWRDGFTKAILWLGY
jgi:alpha-glucosidase